MPSNVSGYDVKVGSVRLLLRTDRVLMSTILVSVTISHVSQFSRVVIIYISVFTDLKTTNTVFTPEYRQCHWNVFPWHCSASMACSAWLHSTNSIHCQPIPQWLADRLSKYTVGQPVHSLVIHVLRDR